MELVIKYAPVVAQLLGALVVIASIIVRITPSQKDDKKLAKYANYFFKFMSYLPTIGINPNTRKLQEAYEELRKK